MQVMLAMIGDQHIGSEYRLRMLSCISFSGNEAANVVRMHMSNDNPIIMPVSGFEQRNQTGGTGRTNVNDNYSTIRNDHIAVAMANFLDDCDGKGMRGNQQYDKEEEEPTDQIPLFCFG